MSKTPQQRALQFSGMGLIVRNKELWCKLCNVPVDHTKKFVIEKHIKTKSHERNQALLKGQNPIQDAFEKQSTNEEIWSSLAAAFVSAGVPIHAIGNPKLQKWLNSNVKHGNTLPSERSFRRFLVVEGSADLEVTKNMCRDQGVIIEVDETQDSKCRKIINALIKPAKPGQHFRLLNVEILDQCNAEAVVQFIIRSLQLIDVPLNHVVAIVSDNAAYMISAANKFIALTGRTFHTTCWAHVLHLISEEVRNTLALADSFIAKLKAALVKAPARRSQLLEILKHNNRPVNLPPSPVITRWTTWLAAGSYHHENFDSIKEWIKSTSRDSKAIEVLQTIVDDASLRTELRQIHDIYSPLSATIKKLESSQILATDVLLQLETILALLTSSPVLQSAFEKLEFYLNEKHPARDFWKQVEYFDPRKQYRVRGNGLQLPPEIMRMSMQPIPTNEIIAYNVICSGYVAAENFCPVKFWEGHTREFPTLCALALTAISIPASSADVERSFSSLNRLLSPHRNRLSAENIGIHLRIQFNNRSEDLEPMHEELNEDFVEEDAME